GFRAGRKTQLIGGIFRLVIATRDAEVDDIARLGKGCIAEATGQIPAFIAFGGDVAFGALAEDAHRRRPVRTAAAETDTQMPVGAEQVGDTAFVEGGVQAAGQVFETKGLLETADGNPLGAKAGVLDPGVANAAGGAVGTAGTGKIVLEAVIPVLGKGAAHVEEEAADGGAVTEIVVVRGVEGGIGLEPAANLERVGVVDRFETQAAAIGGGDDSALGGHDLFVDLLLLIELLAERRVLRLEFLQQGSD